MAPIVVIGHLITSTPSARRTLITELAKISFYSLASEPDVVKYAITVPRDPADETSIYVVEQYRTQAALTTHMSSPAVSSILSFFAANPSLLAGPGKVYTMDHQSGYTSPSAARASDAVIAFGPAGNAECVEGVLGQHGVLGYQVLRDREGGVERCLGIFEGEGGARVVGEGKVLLKVEAGFLYRGSLRAVL